MNILKKLPFEKEESMIFGSIYRPVMTVDFWSKKYRRFLKYSMIVDSGADYTLFPRYVSTQLGIDLKNECRKYRTFGVGGEETVYVVPKISMRLDRFPLDVPVGFLDRDDLPPLLGRQNCLNEIDVVFSSLETFFLKRGSSQKFLG